MQKSICNVLLFVVKKEKTCCLSLYDVQRSLEDPQKPGSGSMSGGGLGNLQRLCPWGSHPSKKWAGPAPSGGKGPAVHGVGRGSEPAVQPFSSLGTSHK